MENLRLNSLVSGYLSVLLGFWPNVAGLPELLNVWADLALKFVSLVSVLLIIYLNLRKIRNPHAIS